MANLGNTTRPAYVYDAETDTWLPIGVGAHSHDYTTQFIGKTLVDAKGDIVTASASDTPAILSKGADGTILVADSSTSTGLAWQPYGAIQVAGKNKIINGDFSINQRGFTSTTTTQTYGFDRWTFLSAGDGSTTYSAQTFTPGTAPLAGYEATNFARLVTAGQTTSSSQSYLIQRIENVRTLANQTATVSFWAKAASGTPKISIEFGQNFGAGGSATAYTNGGTVTLSTSWARYSSTVLISSISGKTIGDNANRLFLTLYTSAGSDITTRANSIGIQNNTIDIWGVQVEAGPIATPFTTATGTIQGELAACQRYYYRSQPGSNGYARVASGRATSTTNLDLMIPLPSPMRVPPTSVEYSTLITTTANSPSSIVLTQSTTTTAVCDFTTTGITTDRFYQVMGNNSTSAYIGFSAEL